MVVSAQKSGGLLLFSSRAGSGSVVRSSSGRWFQAKVPESSNLTPQSSFHVKFGRVPEGSGVGSRSGSESSGVVPRLGSKVYLGQFEGEVSQIPEGSGNRCRGKAVLICV